MAQRMLPAYIVLTNVPYEHHLDDTQWRHVAIGDGFHIHDFKMDQPFPTLRGAIEARQTHVEMRELLHSMKSHATTPVTFDGENPELAYSASEPRLLVGNKYRVPDADGTEVDGVLVSAVVVEHEQVAMCIVNTDDGRGLVVKIPLTEPEMLAWRRHPDTFFGEISQNGKAESAIDVYDFLIKTYALIPKQKLLEFLAGATDFDRLSTLGQEELASIYCERLASTIAAQSGPPSQPLLKTKWQPAARRET